MIEIISATRLSPGDFWNCAPLGLSLQRLAYDDRFVARVSASNQHGLPEIYNQRIAADDSGDILIFMHDDVWIDDYYLADRVMEGLRTYDVIGVAGNRRRMSMQPNWAFVDTKMTWDDKARLSGAIAHGDDPCGPVTYYGTAPAECELLDGVFLAAKKATLRERNVLFDNRFDFHYYDMDFCRTARQNGLRLGTWPICLTHQSKGGFTQKWLQAYNDYITKWGS